MSPMLFSHFLLSVFAKTEYSIKDTWPYADNVLDPCFPDPCNSQGICSSSEWDELTYTCACINGWTGDTCTEELGECDEDYCENGGSCYWTFETQTCFCATGYTGDTCSEFSEELNDPCMYLVCGDEGHGSCVVSDEGEGECDCEEGYTGDFCTESIPSCTATQFMDLVQQLIEDYPDFTDDCTYMATQIWAMIPLEDDQPALCNCLTAMQQYIPDSYDALDCAIDHGYTFDSAVDRYCPVDCTQDTIDEMLTTVAALNDDCHHYIYNGASMPLYRQNQYECSCLTGLATTYDEALEVFSCPFTLTSASSGAIAWQNCNDNVVCDFQSMYTQVQDEFAPIDAIAAQYCMDFVEAMSLTEVVTPENNALLDFVSPCLEGIYTKWPSGIDAFDCMPVPHYDNTIKEIMETVYHDTRYAQPSCTYSIASSIFSLAEGDFSGATMCLQSLVLGDQIATTNQNFDELFCACYDRLADIDSFDASYMEECAVTIDWIVPSPQSYCEEYLDKTYSFLSEKVEDLVTVPEVSFATSVSDETVWATVGIISTCVLVGLVSLNIWLFVTSKKSTSYKDIQKGTTAK